MKPGHGHAEHLTHHRDWEAGPLRRDDPVNAHGVSVSAAKEDRGSLEYVARLFDAFDATTQFTRLLALGRGQPVAAFVLVELVLLDPVMQRLLAAAQAPGYISDAATGEYELHGLDTAVSFVA